MLPFIFLVLLFLTEGAFTEAAAARKNATHVPHFLFLHLPPLPLRLCPLPSQLLLLRPLFLSRDGSFIVLPYRLEKMFVFK